MPRDASEPVNGGAPPVFEVEGLSKVYRMGEVEVHALREVDLRLPERQFVVLLGPSGSGKSTLLNLLGGPGGEGSRHGDHICAEVRAILGIGFRCRPQGLPLWWRRRSRCGLVPRAHLDAGSVARARM